MVRNWVNKLAWKQSKKEALPYIVFRMESQIVRCSLACHLPGNTHQHSGDIVLTWHFFMPIVQPSSNPSFSSSVCSLSVMHRFHKDTQDSSFLELALRSNYMYSSKMLRMLSGWIKHSHMHVQCLLVNGRLTPACCKYVCCSLECTVRRWLLSLMRWFWLYNCSVNCILWPYCCKVTVITHLISHCLPQGHQSIQRSVYLQK